MTGDVVAAARALDRRGFLRLTAAVAAAGLLPTGCGGVPAAFAPPADVSLQVLSPRAWATLTAAAARCAGPPLSTWIGEGRLQPARIADAWLGRMPQVAGPLTQALSVLEWGVWPLIDKVRPFTTLDGDAQDAVLASLRTSRVALKRALYGGVRSVALLGVYLAPETRAFTGHPGPFGDGRITTADAMRPMSAG